MVKAKVFCSLTNSFIVKIDRGVFFALEKYLIESGNDSDKENFSEIKRRLSSPPVLNCDDFAKEVIYVILASGFNQKTAKKKYNEILNFISKGGVVIPENLLKIFANKNKINAICDVWKNRDYYTKMYYSLNCDDTRLDFLEKLPYIGAITKNHLARNLGINKVKYDVWIQRLGASLYSKCDVVLSELTDETKYACDKMFENIAKETKLPVGYIDVVLWKSCQIGLLKFIL